MLVFGHFRHHRVLLEKLQWCLLMEPSSRGSTQANFLDDFKKKFTVLTLIITPTRQMCKTGYREFFLLYYLSGI